MPPRLRSLVLASVLGGALPAAAQPIDVLTGEPVRPRSAHPRPEPEIFNAPHAPRQSAGRPGDGPPMEIYITPQIGGGTPYQGQPGPGRRY